MIHHKSLAISLNMKNVIAIWSTFVNTLLLHYYTFQTVYNNDIPKLRECSVRVPLITYFDSSSLFVIYFFSNRLNLN